MRVFLATVFLTAMSTVGLAQPKYSLLRAYWKVEHAKNCTLTRSDAGIISTAFFSGTDGLAAKNITGQTIFSLTCKAEFNTVEPNTVTKNVTVNVVPTYQEE